MFVAFDAKREAETETATASERARETGQLLGGGELNASLINCRVFKYFSELNSNFK